MRGKCNAVSGKGMEKACIEMDVRHVGYVTGKSSQLRHRKDYSCSDMFSYCTVGCTQRPSCNTGVRLLCDYSDMVWMQYFSGYLEVVESQKQYCGKSETSLIILNIVMQTLYTCPLDWWLFPTTFSYRKCQIPFSLCETSSQRVCFI